ncbi:hypothetical protein FOA52_006152 [Chlamydomonas sp. UWO 241]|nr:hypothetical protein FOA52_006152 [Chlamydomonas sp. UWO 241]
MLIYPEVGLCSNDVPEARAARLEADAAKHWDNFYANNADRFYKDRHYFDREFPELASGSHVLLEVGCGAGNTVFPCLEMNPQLRIYACDFSHRAVSIVQAHPNYGPGGVTAFVCDLTRDDLLSHVPPGSVDFVTMVFVLSAISPEAMDRAVANVARVLKRGSGLLLFRDYARGDMAQDKHQASGVKKLAEDFYVRGDGTRCYYFSEDFLSALFGRHGLACDGMKMHEKDVDNHKRQITMHRRWLQGVFGLAGGGPPTRSLELWEWQQGLGQQLGQQQQGQQGQQRHQGQLGQQQGQQQHQGQLGQQQQGQGQGQQQRQQGQGSLRPAPEPPRARTPTSAPEAAAPEQHAAAAHQHHADAHMSEAEDTAHVAGTWLVGAAGRLASGLHALPGSGQRSVHALLPDTLDSADEVSASLRSPAVSAGGTRHELGSPLLSARDVEAELEAEFFATVSRDTSEVVAEEVAAAAGRVATIRLADPLPREASRWQQQQQRQGCTHGGSVGGSASGSGRQQQGQQPQPQQQHQQHTQQQQSQQQGQQQQGYAQQQRKRKAEPACGCDASVMMAVPGSSLSWALPGGVPFHPSSSVAPTDAESLAHELGLASLVAACPAVFSERCAAQLNAGAAGLAAMTAARIVRRVVATAPERRPLEGLSRSLRANSRRLVVERVRACPLAWRDPGHLAMARRQAVAPPTGPGCFELVFGAGLLQAAMDVDARNAMADGAGAANGAALPGGLDDVFTTARALVEGPGADVGLLLSSAFGSIRAMAAAGSSATPMAGVEGAAGGKVGSSGGRGARSAGGARGGGGAPARGALLLLLESRASLKRAMRSGGLSGALSRGGWAVVPTPGQVAAWLGGDTGSQFAAVALVPSPGS